MNHGSLFSGIGGFDLAAEWMGWTNAFHCEWNEFGQKILKYYWPNAISYGDITKTDFTIWRGRIDVLTGGFPCQPFSMAGKRKGTEDERHLWPEMLRVIREIKPTWVVGENVFGLTNWDGGLVFEQVQADLEAEGYEVQPYVLPACAVNAPHRRDRVWFVSRLITNSSCTGRNGDKESKEGCNSKRTGISQYESDILCSIGVTPDTEGLRVNRTQEHENDCRQGGKRGRCNVNNACKIQGWDNAPDTEGKRVNGISRDNKQQERKDGEWNDELNGNCKVIADSCNQGLQGCKDGRVIRGERAESHKQPARFIRPAWDNFPTQPPLRSRDDGLSSQLAGITVSKHRNESIKAYGNAIVPQVVYQIFKTIEQYESLNP